MSNQHERETITFVNEGLFVTDPKTGKEIHLKVSARVRDLGIHCEFQGTCEVPIGYALPRRASNGDRRASVIENLAPQLKPADLEYRKVWEEAPEVDPVMRNRARLPTVAELVAAGTPEGVAESMVNALHATAEKAKRGEAKA
jgi:hypothetical protein